MLNRVGAQRLTATQLFSEQLDGKILREVWRLQANWDALQRQDFTVSSWETKRSTAWKWEYFYTQLLQDWGSSPKYLFVIWQQGNTNTGVFFFSLVVEITALCNKCFREEFILLKRLLLKFVFISLAVPFNETQTACVILLVSIWHL